jgi:hypothetical protein
MAEMMIRRVGVLSLAKIYGLLMLVFGLIIGVIYGLILIVAGVFMSSIGARGEGAMGAPPIIMGVVAMVAFPVIYGIIGFIAGALGGLIYNVAAGVVGGLELELESTTPSYGAPPPPQQWS